MSNTALPPEVLQRHGIQTLHHGLSSFNIFQRLLHSSNRAQYCCTDCHSHGKRRIMAGSLSGIKIAQHACLVASHP